MPKTTKKSKKALPYFDGIVMSDTSPQKSNWKKEWYRKYSTDDLSKEQVDFIRQLIQKERASLIQELLEKMPKEKDTSKERFIGYQITKLK